MNTYFSTFSSGLGKLIKPVLKKQIKNTHVELLLDGLIVYKTPKSANEIKRIKFFNNSFVLGKLFRGPGNKLITRMVKHVLNNPKLIKDICKNIPQNISSFRLVASKENQLVSVENNLLINFEKLFSEITDLKIDRTNPDLEAWFLERSEDYGFFGIRITHSLQNRKVLEKGELKSELAHILCLISDPQPNDIFLDPFAGHGSIPIKRAISFPYKKIIAGEKNKKIFKTLQPKLKKINREIVVGRWNALKLSALTDNSINKIVTDPPWGIYSDLSMAPIKFYETMISEFSRILAPNGLMVILMGQKEIFDKVLGGFNELKLLEKYDILVSGKKARIYKIRKE